MYIIAYFQVYVIPPRPRSCLSPLEELSFIFHILLVSRLLESDREVKWRLFCPFTSSSTVPKQPRVCWAYVHAQGMAYCGTLSSLFV